MYIPYMDTMGYFAVVLIIYPMNAVSVSMEEPKK